MLSSNTSRSELCKIPIGGLPAIYKHLVDHFDNIQQLFGNENEDLKSIGLTRIRLSNIVLSLLLSNYRVIYELVDKYGFIDSLLKLFYNKNHNCTIFRQIVFNIVHNIMKRPVELIKNKLLTNFANLNKCIEFDLLALEFYKNNNYYPDYYLINTYLMYDYYNNFELDENEEIIIENNIKKKFVSYVKNNILKRINEENEIFNLKESIDHYIDIQAYHYSFIQKDDNNNFDSDFF